jgi:hypothetical protein
MFALRFTTDDEKLLTIEKCYTMAPLYYTQNSSSQFSGSAFLQRTGSACESLSAQETHP